MTEVKNFHLNFISMEEHLKLSNTTSIIVVQKLYEILFQYAITREKEEKLKKFVSLLENHIKGKTRAPFSMPLEELAFLDEGLEELKLLNWMQLPVTVFEIVLDGLESTDDYEAEIEKVLDLLEDIMTFNRKESSNRIYVYPLGMTSY